MNFPSYFAAEPATVLKARGADALPFLQGQFTQELNPRNAERCAYGLWLNQKGKVLGDSFVCAEGDTWWVVSLTSPVAVVRERLEAYIIADDVELSDETGLWTAWTFLGPEAGAWLEGRGCRLPGPGRWSAAAGGGWLLPGQTGWGGAWIWLRRKEAEAPSGVDACTPLDARAFARRRIEAGVVAVPEDIGPTDLPQEGGLEREAISFSKGCYLGQEVMARLQNQGQVRRRLMRVRGTGATPEPSRRVLLSVSGKAAGELRTRAPLTDGKGWVGFAMLSLIGVDRAAPLSLEGGAETGTVRLEDAAP